MFTTRWNLPITGKVEVLSVEVLVVGVLVGVPLVGVIFGSLKMAVELVSSLVVVFGRILFERIVVGLMVV